MKYGHAVRFATDLVIRRGNSILLIKRKYPPLGLALPGGLMDEDEPIEHTASRELLEETGISLEEKDLKFIGIFSDPNRDPRGRG